MTRIPTAPLILGLAGLIPFVVGTLTTLGWLPTLWGFGGPVMALSYGTVILCFMSGVLWGFATKAEGHQAAIGYSLSVVPALWAFFMAGDGLSSAVIYKVVGFVGLLMLDYQFSVWGLTPKWWMKLRILLTSIVVLCLLGLLI